jgi:hypothetical protein
MATKLLTKAAGQKDSIPSQNDGASSSGAELPEAAEPSTPEKAKTINVWNQRDVVMLGQVMAAMAIPTDADEQTQLGMPDSAVARFQDFQAVDSIECIIAGLMCGISDMTMESLARATRSANPQNTEMFAKIATKGALVVTELAKAFDQHRGRDKQTMSVGQVNVQAGGQAVVGNVTSARKIEDPALQKK